MIGMETEILGYEAGEVKKELAAIAQQERANIIRKGFGEGDYLEAFERLLNGEDTSKDEESRQNAQVFSSFVFLWKAGKKDLALKTLGTQLDIVLDNLARWMAED